tara:strand:+ start:226 stop:519 length:294 start_codon:yes stop_codon:yes gene_type:complete
MGRPKLPEFTAQDADDYGHLKAQAADILRKIEALKKKAIKSKIDCKEGSMFSVIVTKADRTSLDSKKVKLLLQDRISLVQQTTTVTTVRVNARKLVF